MSLVIFAGILFNVVILVQGEAPPCPPSQDVYPCFCDGDELLTSIFCESFSSLDKLYHVMKNVRKHNLSFAFTKSKLGDIPSDFFEGQQSVLVHFENCQIGSFGSRPFSGLENSLKSVFIYGSINKRRKDLETFPLGHLKKLESLQFQANDIKRLGNDWFNGGPESLEYLNLEANDIEELGDKAFVSLVNVAQIWLGDNSFKKVSRSMFPRPAKKLNLLEMSFSGYDELPEDMFDDMPALRRVIVSGNRLQTVPEATWGKIWDQLEEVYLERK
ncbi:carboxypeptidase N subunit 2 [Trichonephila clavipes]|nr:carboxypeptidase N subunit 2 [Trichonephila clavipes]